MNEEVPSKQFAYLTLILLRTIQSALLKQWNSGTVTIMYSTVAFLNFKMGSEMLVLMQYTKMFYYTIIHFKLTCIIHKYSRETLEWL